MARYYGAAAELEKRNKRRLNINIKALLIIFGGIVLVLTIVGVAFLISSNTSVASFPKLVARQQNLQMTTNVSGVRIKDPTLITINADANALFLGDLNAYKVHLKEKMGMNNVPKDIAKTESNAENIARIDEGFLLNKYDSTYVDVLRDQIAATLELTDIIRKDADQTLTKLLDTATFNLKNIDGRLAELNL